MKTIGELLVEVLSKPIQLEFDFVDNVPQDGNTPVPILAVVSPKQEED